MDACRRGNLIWRHDLRSVVFVFGRLLTGPDKHEKVLEKLATSDKATIVIERQPDGKMRVTSGSWDGEKVILKDQVLEVRNVDGRLHVARKPRRPD